jgi:4-hydroxybenzoate polyprenyltransferase
VVKILNKLGQEFIYGGHLLSLGALGIVWSVMLITGNSGGWVIFILAYLASQIVYNHDHMRDLQQDSVHSIHERSWYLAQTITCQRVLMIVYITLFLAVAVMTTLSASLLAVSIVAGGVLYTIKFKKLMKRFVGLKNIYVALFWSLLVFLVPFHFSTPAGDIAILVIVLFVFIRWVINSAFFDIKDIRSDSELGLKTLPVRFGISTSIYYLHMINIMSFGLLLLAILYNTVPTYTSALLFFPLYSFYYLYVANKLTDRELRRISYIVVDGEYILWPIALLSVRLFL